VRVVLFLNSTMGANGSLWEPGGEPGKETGAEPGRELG